MFAKPMGSEHSLFADERAEKHTKNARSCCGCEVILKPMSGNFVLRLWERSGEA